MRTHDRLAAHELIHRYWYNYDEGNLDVLESLFTDDCHVSSRTELGTHPHEEFMQAYADYTRLSRKLARKHLDRSAILHKFCPSCGTEIHVIAHDRAPHSR